MLGRCCCCCARCDPAPIPAAVPAAAVPVDAGVAIADAAAACAVVAAALAAAAAAIAVALLQLLLQGTTHDIAHVRAKAEHMQHQGAFNQSVRDAARTRDGQSMDCHLGNAVMMYPTSWVAISAEWASQARDTQQY